MKWTLGLIPLVSFPLWANPVITPPTDFGGGYVVNTVATQIQDNQSPDMSNMINNRNGIAEPRNGSKRYYSQATSTNPVRSLYRVYQSSMGGVAKGILMMSGNKVYISTNDTSLVAPSTFNWIVVSSGTAQDNQSYSFAAMGNRVIFTGDGLVDPIKELDLSISSAPNLLEVRTSSQQANFYAKYLLNSKNYLLAANIRDLKGGTTDYFPARVMYTRLLERSSFTTERILDVGANDGEEITGLGKLGNVVDIFKESSIYELSFSVLNPTYMTPAGDQVLRQVANFGCIAPRSLQTAGLFYIFLSKDGILLWNGGLQTRLEAKLERSVISDDIKPIIDEIIRNGTYRSAVGKYYPKKQWYLFSYEDPKRYPRGRNNATLVYDFVTGQWFPFNNWLVDSYMTMDGAGDKGELLYGDSMDGYVHYADVETSPDDSRKEISIDNMNNEANWILSTQDTVNVMEGTASLKLSLTPSVSIASMSLVRLINAGDWYDKSKITKSDKLAFKIYPTSISNITNIRVDIEFNDVTTFDSNFSSITISSAEFKAGATAWSTIELPISSFTIERSWIDLSTETLVFANTLTFYGIRFVVNGIGGAVVSFDDLRIVQGTDNPINPYRFTKQFNLNEERFKRYRQLVLNCDLPADSKFDVDVFNDFGQVVETVRYKGGFDKNIFVTGFGGSTGIVAINSTDFSVVESTNIKDRQKYYFLSMTADQDFVYAADHTNHKIAKIQRGSFTATNFDTVYGGLGSGATTFNTIYQMAVDDTNIYICDFINQRIKVHRKKNFDFIGSFGALGNGTTNVHNPTGIAVDDSFLYIGDDGNYRIMKISKSTFGFITSVDLNLNTIGDTTLSVDDSYLYDAYDTLSELSLNNQDIVLEKRNKSDLSLVNKVILRPVGITEVTVSSSALLGDITIDNRYIYVSFTDDINQRQTSKYYIQKRLKSDFSIVKEYVSHALHNSITANSLSFKPTTRTIYKDIGLEGNYIQFKYYANKFLDNKFKLINQSFSVIGEGEKEH